MNADTLTIVIEFMRWFAPGFLVFVILTACFLSILSRGEIVGCCALCGNVIRESDDFVNSPETVSPVHVDCYDHCVEKNEEPLSRNHP